MPTSLQDHLASRRCALSDMVSGGGAMTADAVSQVEEQRPDAAAFQEDPFLGADEEET